VDSRLLDEDQVFQICFVTHDLEESLNWFGDLTGKEPSHIGKAADPAVARAEYMGNPASVNCRLAIFKFGNIDVEFLEPGPERSAWRDLLEEKGPGVHHIAFRTRNMTRRSAYLKGKGLALLQKAEFDGGGGRYAYFDATPRIGIQLELLEWDSNKDLQP
jgi:hypothetical protein